MHGGTPRFEKRHEVTCKFMGHVVPSEDIKRLKPRDEEIVSGTCKRCNFEITIRRDPEDDDHYLVSDVV